MTLRDREPRCRWTLEYGWLSPGHARDCDDTTCPGCKPCPQAHCAMHGTCATHVDTDAGLRTCPSCIGTNRRDLSKIGDLYAVAGTLVESRTGAEVGILLDEVTESGVDSEAFNLVGPAAAPDQYDARQDWNRELGEAQEWRRGWCTYPRPVDEQDDRHHPYLVLGRWDIRLRDVYGPQTDLFITVTSSIDYLTRLLVGPFPHTDEFEDFARDVAQCRNHLETVIHDSRAPERGRPCPKCTDDDTRAPRLQKRYAAHIALKPGEPCQRPDCRTCAGRDDTWHCPSNAEHWWSEEDYRLRVSSDYRAHATTLPAAELAERIGVSLSTLRKWTSRTWDPDAETWIEPRLVSRRKGPDGRKVYPVAAVLDLAVRRGA